MTRACPASAGTDADPWPSRAHYPFAAGRSGAGRVDSLPFRRCYAGLQGGGLGGGLAVSSRTPRSATYDRLRTRIGSVHDIHDILRRAAGELAGRRIGGDVKERAYADIRKALASAVTGRAGEHHPRTEAVAALPSDSEAAKGKLGTLPGMAEAVRESLGLDIGAPSAAHGSMVRL